MRNSPSPSPDATTVASRPTPLSLSKVRETSERLMEEFRQLAVERLAYDPLRDAESLVAWAKITHRMEEIHQETSWLWYRWNQQQKQGER